MLLKDILHSAFKTNMRYSFCSIFVITSLVILNTPTDALDTEHCLQRETSFAFFDLVKKSISNARDLLSECGESSNSTLSIKSISLIDDALELLKEAKDNYPTGERTKKEEYVDCLDALKKMKQPKSGIYRIAPKQLSITPRDVYCDMDTDRGGWTVIQRRGNFSEQEDFFRDWTDYKRGFGNLTRDFWIGNNYIYALSNKENHTSIRFELEDEWGGKAFAQYDSFQIEAEDNLFKLHISGYNGNAGDPMIGVHDKMSFSTKDWQNDLRSSSSPCTREQRGGWWYGNCGLANPNGLYRPGERGFDCIYWYTWKGIDCLKSMEIKIR